jgi:hypothetical protein
MEQTSPPHCRLHDSRRLDPLITAVLLEPDESGYGIMDALIRSDGSGMIHLHQKAGGSRMPPTAETVAKRLHYVHQEGAAFAWTHRFLRPIFLTAVFWNLSWFILQAAYVPYVPSAIVRMT